VRVDEARIESALQCGGVGERPDDAVLRELPPPLEGLGGGLRQRAEHPVCGIAEQFLADQKILPTPNGLAFASPAQNLHRELLLVS
jgi:hypothetical protein